MNEIKKSQAVRLIDVFALGPVMVYIGSTAKLKDWEKIVLVTSGIGTILYNGKNYLANRKNLVGTNSVPIEE